MFIQSPKSLGEIFDDQHMSTHVQYYSESDVGSRPDFEDVVACYRIWKEFCGDRPAPLRTHLKPERFGKLLNHLVLLDVLEGGGDFRYVIFGALHERHYGDRLTGRRLSELGTAGGPAEPILDLFRQCVADCVPIWHVLFYLSVMKTVKAAQGCIMPLVDDDGRVTSMLGASSFNDFPRTLLPAPLS